MIDNTLIHSEVRELEKIISLMQGVNDVVVISVEQPSGDSILRAFVEPKEDNRLNVQQIITQCISKSTFNRAPASVTFTKIPRTPSGKVARQVLLEQFAV